jgi:8-hydroxy-5-deazaflavin:NADPH oxidoreductase
MKIGIIGAGHIGKAFAKQVVNAGYEVLISNSRGPETLADAVQALGGNTKAVTMQDAALADVVFISVTWDKMQEVTASIPSWQGRIVIDASNPVLPPDFRAAELNGRASSEYVADWTPGASVVKAFNTYTPELLGANPKEAGGSRVIFYCGDDKQAKEVVAGIIAQIGFAGVDIGSLSTGGKLQQFPGGSLAGLNLIKL